MTENAKKVGRPFKFTDPEELKLKIEAYFNGRDPHIVTQKVKVGEKPDGTYMYDFREVMTKQLPYTVGSLAIFLNTTRQTLVDYSNPLHYPEGMADEVREQLIDTIEMAKARCEAYAEDHLFSGKPTRGAEFVLQNGYNWKQKSEVDNTVRNVEAELDATEQVDKGKDELAEAAEREMNADQPAPAAPAE